MPLIIEVDFVRIYFDTCVIVHHTNQLSIFYFNAIFFLIPALIYEKWAGQKHLIKNSFSKATYF